MIPLRAGPGAFRTTRDAAGLYATSDWLLMATAFCLGPPFIGGLVAFLFAKPAIEGSDGWATWLAEVGTRLVFAPVLTIIVAPVALGAFALLLRLGWAGWAVIVALAATCVLAMSLFNPAAAPFFNVACMLHALCLWWAAAHPEPGAKAARVNQS